jgi:sec-independent protein translocase protein TatC
VSQEDIDATRAPLMEHLIELRSRLIWSFLAIFLTFVLCFYFAEQIFDLLLIPYQRADDAWRAANDLPVADSTRLIFTAPQEFFFTQLKLALFGALFLSFPVIASQLYMFVAPGLYSNERHAFLPFLLATPILFVLGASLVYFFVMPLGMQFFLGFQKIGPEVTTTIELLPQVSKYLSLIMTLIFAFGLCFQLPVLLTLLGRVGLLTSEGLKKNRKFAVVGAFTMAAVLTPPDPISQLGLGLPTIILYELSIFSVRLVEKKRKEAQEKAKKTAATGSDVASE